MENAWLTNEEWRVALEDGRTGKVVEFEQITFSNFSDEISRAQLCFVYLISFSSPSPIVGHLWAKHLNLLFNFAHKSFISFSLEDGKEPNKL